ncbi:glycosyltransferase [Jiulongibacter sediminis]|jgi:glycosyltransferase involved in cell wall biosynthesis|uniref:glycosyltransferase n=1 Tax=Jiulongibacter sediminis TaxID=1605367 RepID=UPI0026F05399|nr:glycosyltransferase [Jiulongibacter sediminis]
MQGISILICCYNSEDKIGLTLQHLSLQKSGNIPWEIILINNNSTDNTAKVAQKAWKDQTTPFRIIDEPRAGLSFARTTGVEVAQYDIISFVDDDNLVPENWIEYQFNTFQKPEIDILGCTSVGYFNFTPPDWYKKEIHQLAFATGPIHTDKLKNITQDGLVYGAGMTLRKKIYSNLKALNWQPLLTGRIGNKQAGGEDSELTLAARLLGYSIYYSNEIKTQHNISENRLTWERLKNVTRGFGSADVFLTPYNYYYLDKNNRLSFFQSLRKFWWFNYFGKKGSLILWTIRHHMGQIDKEDFEILSIRLQAFCDTLRIEKSRFKESFRHVKELIK